jgi:hypothetical protein|tara:strand:- start:51201 stop:52163 length:963 start_codon:yes stop_codon:yes gene_type:complete
MRPFATHSVPRFEGEGSRRHQDVPLWRLAWNSLPTLMANPRAFLQVRSFVQFAGFPRSGHSLIGSIIDAHPSAVISHELDAMGLIRKGVPLSLLHDMVADNSRAFSEAGRYWNGLRYQVPGYAHGIKDRPLVVGDKKGDWAVRWCAEDPGLLDRAQRLLGSGSRWILVARNPFDNIATMSLRKGREYDRLRIANSADTFRRALREAQERGRVSASALDEMIDDYETLCETTEQMKTRLPDGDWHEIVYERFTKHPFGAIEDLLTFLGLNADPTFVTSAASIVRESRHRSRDDVVWSAQQKMRVAAMTRRFSFLRAYAEND